MVCEELHRLFPDVDITEYNDFKDYVTALRAHHAGVELGDASGFRL